ncbi:hypothetical protein FQN60_015824 [Etheostoma spectabile]|uniref:DNA helicase MCM9 n=1 Tax=Etheostoma spectabile TaxID=54343 RepID=A0A5J5CML1_9PERO|nr:hypothetical protein FQN60_015824 [Etheostoma spectabile]
MLISPDKEALIGRVFEAYLTEYHHGDILHLIEDITEETHRPVVVNAMTLFEANMEVGDYFNAYPNDVLAIFDKVLHRKGLELSESASPKHYGEKEERTKERMRCTLHVRITGLPVCPELTRDTIPRSRDVGHFLSVTGTVIRTSVAKVLEYERDYMCTKCRHIFTVEADFDQFYTFVPPVACPNPDACNSYKFSCLSGGSEPAACRDFQEIKIQEQVQRLSVGSIPRSMVVVLEDDLVDSCKSGDDVTVYGVMCQRWKPFYDGTRCDTELVLKANNIEVNNQQAAASFLMNDVQKEFNDFWMSYKHDPIAGRNQILSSICPQVFGMYVIKLAVAMVLAGGVQRTDSSGTKIRGKSQFLKYAAKIMPRSVLTAGIGSTSAGLTVAAVKDGGDWHLEAGALVLSDGGLCCIDEFNSIKEHDRISIHEAMEQQSISVAKAGMVCKLNTRTTILAATNPKGQYNPNEPLSVNVALASPLLSRFDLVLVLLDTRNSDPLLLRSGLPAESASLWSMEKIKAYFSVIKRLQPQVSEEAKSILTRYYQLQRQSDGRNAARTTIRMLESLSRLAEAHARLMYRETVTIEDAVIAVSVMECSMQGGALLGNVNALLTSFPDDPSQQYQNQCQILLEGLNLPLLLQKEMDRQAKLKSNISEASQFDPPVDYQHQPRDTNIINKTRCPDITNNCKGDVTVESGLDWFLSITPSLSDGMTSSIITSTQGNLNRKQSWSDMSTLTKQPNCQSKDIPSINGSSLNHDVISNPIETVASVTSEENGKSEKNVKEKSLNQKQIKQSKKPEDKKHPDSTGCVIQKVSKNLRDKRMELDLNQQQSDKAGEGEGHEERVMSGDTSENCLSNNLVQDNLLSGQDSRLEKKDEWDQARTKNISTLLNEKMAAEAETEKQLNAKFSGFRFKPRKMRPLVHNLNASPDVSTEFQNNCNPGSRDPHTYKESRISKQKPDSYDDSPVPFTNTEKNKRQNQYQILLECGKQLNCVSEVGEKRAKTSISFSSKELDKYDFSFGKGKLAHDKTVGRIKGSDDTENLCQKQRTRDTTCNETNVGTCVRPLKPTTCINDPAPSKSSHTKPTLALSTLAKLSSFSFSNTTEFPIAAQKKVEKNPTAVGKSTHNRHGAECSKANSKDKKTLNPPENSPLLRKINTVITAGKVKDTLPAPATELAQELEHKSGKELPIETKCKAKQTEPTHAANHVSVNMVKDGLVDYETTAILKKRKCFELGAPLSSIGGSEGPFSRLSLPGFVELGNDVFDTDWDKEVSKRAKIGSQS